MRCCGPKCSACLLIISCWGVLMLLLLGVFARVNAVALSEDIPLDEAAWIKNGYPGQAIDEAYVMMSNNCFIAAGIYGVIVVLAGVQFYFAKRRDRLSH